MAVRFSLAAVAFWACAPAAMSQVDLDGSFPRGAGVALRSVHTAVADQVLDPNSVQYKRMRHNERMICGLLNSRSPNGGYGEFGPFLYAIADGTVLVVSPSQLAGFRGTLTTLFEDAGCPLSSLGLGE